jgi:phosphoribosyl-ATP pyrophosphohydrolase
MASPRRIYEIYRLLAENAQEIQDFQIAAGDKPSGTVGMLLKGDRQKFLTRWGEEMHELAGVIGGTHDDPYIVEATQCFYWTSLYAVSGGTSWDEIEFDQLRTQVGRTGIEDIGNLADTADRMVALGEQAKPGKLFLLWHVADRLYREANKPDQQWSIEQMMEYDLADMKKRSYLAPLIRQTEGL